MESVCADCSHLGYGLYCKSNAFGDLTFVGLAVTDSRNMATAQSASDKKTALQKQIQALTEQMHALDQEAIHELKLKISDARKVVQTLEAELQQLTGKSSDSTTPKTRRERRPSIADDALLPQVLKVMAHHGQSGMNAKQLAAKLNQDALRIRKFIGSNPNALKRTGSGPGTKFFLP